MAITYKYDPELNVDQIIGLYETVGWSAYSNPPESLIDAIDNSTFVVAACDGDELIGLARCISDDVAICYLQDILVDPKVQRSGIGRELFRQCTERFGHVRMFVLMTDDEPLQHAFYTSMGMQNLADAPTLRVFFTSNRTCG